MGDTFPVVKVAAVHAASVYLDRDKTLEKAVGLIEEAAAEGAKLIAFPESFLPGFPFWISTHTPTEGAPLFQALFQNAVTIPSPALDVLSEAARAADAHVVMGTTERDGGTLYNTVLYFDNHGEIIGRHRKLQPTHVERTIWGRGDGNDLFVCDTPFGKLGGLTCWEHTMDLVRYSLACMGEQIHVAVWPAVSAVTHNPNSGLFDSVTEAAAKHHALSTQTFVINVQSRIDEDAIEKLGFTDRPDMMRTGGGWTAVIAPNGQIIAGPHTDDEAIIYAELDMSMIMKAKYACDSVGHYARPDVVRLSINRSTNPIYEETGGPSSAGGPLGDWVTFS
jgi:aliphatic nitrilase